MAKQGYEAYQSSQQGGGHGQQNPGNNQSGGDFGVTGGSRFNAPGTGHDSGSTPFNTETAAQHASNENSGKDSDFFGSAMSFIQKRMADGDSKDDVDEDAVQNAHKEAYDNDNGGKMDSNQMGAAAAMQAFKKFTGGGASGQSESGGDFQSKIMGMAMKEATSLFDKNGGNSGSSDKQDVVNSAAETVMKLMIKNQVSGMMGGGSSSGVSSMIGKFM